VGGAQFQAQLAVVDVQYIQSMLRVICPVDPLVGGQEAVLQDAIRVIGNAVLGSATGLPHLLPCPYQIVPSRRVEP
jgi:hypothetical protein